MTREALDGDDLEARSGDGHNRAAGKEDTPAHKGKGNPTTAGEIAPSASRPLCQEAH
ncbi:hypothetical protein GCM10028793_58210 [Nocardiopsis oceani]